jgi:hypothetical protein
VITSAAVQPPVKTSLAALRFQLGLDLRRNRRYSFQAFQPLAEEMMSHTDDE